MSKEPWQGLLSCRARMLLVAPDKGREKWRKQPGKRCPGQQASVLPRDTRAKCSTSPGSRVLSALFWHCTGNIRQPILVWSFCAAPLPQGERAVNVNAEHTVQPHPWLPAIQRGKAGTAVRVPSQCSGDNHPVMTPHMVVYSDLS